MNKVMNKKIGKVTGRAFLALFVLVLAVVSNVNARAEFSASVSPNSYEVGWGASQTVTVKVHCSNTFQTCNCYEDWIEIPGAQYYFDVNAGQDVYRSTAVRAPTLQDALDYLKSDGHGSLTYRYWIYCTELLDSTHVGQQLTVTVNYPTAQQWTQYSTAGSAKTSASNAVNTASSEINSAQSKITEASGVGADVSSATQYINSAQSDYSSANTLLSSGNTAYTNKDYPSATSYYTQAQSKADSAQTKAASAKSAVDKLLEEYNKKQTQAQNKVSDANSAIDTAKLRIGAADKVISDATVIGLDTAQAKADVATARSKIDTAGAYYKEASNMFSAKNFGSAESKAQSAINLADEAEKLATTAYNRLNERLAVSGESSKAILNANTEVSQMNEILTKMDYIVRSTEKWGVGLAETKAVVSAAKTNVDSAEDLLSQAKNRQASGSFNDAVSFGNQARDKAASSKNRLDTMAQTVSVSVQDSLEKAHSRLKAKITEAETEVQSAQNTYGATPSLIVDAQTDVSSAKNALAQAEKEIEAVASASELMPLLSKAEQAFKSLDATEQKTASAVANAKNAKQGLTKKLAIGAAVAAGAAGGGFLYYRYRQRKKDGKKSEHKTEEKETKKENKDEKETISSEAATAEVKKEETKKEHKEEKKHEKPPKKCPQCSAKLKKGQKFCNKCGKQIMTGGV